MAPKHPPVSNTSEIQISALGGEEVQNDFTSDFAGLRSSDQNHHFLPREEQGAELHHHSKQGSCQELLAALLGAAPSKDSASEILGKALLPSAQARAPAEALWAASFLCRQWLDLWAVTPFSLGLRQTDKDQTGSRVPRSCPVFSQSHPLSHQLIHVFACLPSSKRHELQRERSSGGGQGGGQTLSGVSAEEDPLLPLS